jgi:4-amino-4-deoxy-L-arabinose transferase-like glycosyltransferase
LGDTLNSAIALALVGLYLGWQAALGVAVLTALFAVAGAAARIVRPALPLAPTNVLVLIAAAIHLAGWQWLAAQPMGLDGQSGILLVLGWIATLGLLLVATAALSRPGRAVPRPASTADVQPLPESQLP